jgi:predicted membrane-bound mannosyltransferase
MFTGAPMLVLDIAASQMRDRRREARGAAQRAAARHPRTFWTPARHR